MSRKVTRSYSRYTIDALQLMASIIKSARKGRKLTMQEVADRVGISRGLLQRIEKGDTKCEIGVVFEVAAVVGIELFSSDEQQLSHHLKNTQEKLSLMPKSVRKNTKKVDDDF